MTLFDGADGIDFDQYVDLVHTTGKLEKIDAADAAAAEAAYDAVEAGLDGKKLTESQEAKHVQNRCVALAVGTRGGPWLEPPPGPAAWRPLLGRRERQTPQGLQSPRLAGAIIDSSSRTKPAPHSLPPPTTTTTTAPLPALQSHPPRLAPPPQ